MKTSDIITKAKGLLDSKDKILILILSFFTFIGLLLEVVGIAIIIPIIRIAISSDQDSSVFLNIDFNELALSYNIENPLNFLLILLLLIFFIKMIFFVLLYYKQKTFVSGLINKISDKLFWRYSTQNLNYYTKKNRSLIIQNLQNESYFLFLFFESLTVLISEALLIFVSLFFILYFDPKGLVYLLSYFGLAAIVFMFLTKSKSIYWGNKRLELDQKLSKLILETFGFIKEVIVNNSQDFFNKKFRQLNKSKYRYFSYRLTLDQIPRIYFEFITVLFLIFYTFYLTYLNESTESIIIKLGILIAVSYKVMPALSKVSASYQTIKNTSSSLRTIYNEISSSTDDLSNKELVRSFNNQIHFKNLSFRYNQGEEDLIKNMDFKINKNEIIGIIGQSGKGKTTLLDIFSGLIPDYEGELFVDGEKIETNIQQWKPDIGYVSQSTFIFDDTIQNNVIVSRIGLPISENLYSESIKLSRLDEWISSLHMQSSSQISQDGSNISGGQQQRIGIARALYRNSEILVFDEPTSSLDSETESEIMETIYNLKGEKTIIIISHKVSILDQCDRIIKL
ncbi:MAG: hypothetical protein CMD06_02420 [Flavobacteriales bacterium]|nr:hypothetical protein [Flavobacteriales bacterium]|tara:strand:- start:576 stop:2273 length:1698 start_codon:yes stop_codon:yes gene_type:complete